MNAFQRLSLIGFSACHLLVCNLLQCAHAADDASVSVRVLGSDSQPLAGASIKVHLWSGKWDATEFNATTDAAGQVQFSGVKTNQYLTVSAQATGHASVCLDMELSPEEKRSVSFELKPPVVGTVKVLDPQGRPVAGALISWLEFKDSSGGTLFHRYRSLGPFFFEPTISNAEGIIELPPMPEASKVRLAVLHPKYLLKKAEKLVAASGEMATVKLEVGKPLNIHFSPGGGLAAVPDPLPILMNLSSPFARDDISSIYHRTDVTAGMVQLTVQAADYRSLTVSHGDDEYTITPAIHFDDPSLRRLLTVNAVDTSHELAMLVRKNVTVQGKLVGDLTEKIVEAQVIGYTENLHPSLPLAKDDHRWYPAAFAEVKADGTFELQMPPGNARVSVRNLASANVEPAEYEFQIQPGQVPTLPDFRIQKIPNIKGTLVDKQGQPIAGGIVRVMVGVWGSDYVTCDEQGHFELTPDLLLEIKKGAHASVPASIIALDPKTGAAVITPLADDWKSPKQPLKVIAGQHSPEQLLTEIERQMDSAKVVLNIDKKVWETERKQLIEKNPGGLAGNVAPDLAQGTWLNTPHKSLAAFRGKYVLLDFWFIGCGPCEADLPTVKLAHKVFGPDRFSVVSVHATQQTVENVRQYAAAHGMTYPIVVDNDDGDIIDTYGKLGVLGFPSYILLDPDGRILYNDNLADGPSLRVYKLERVLQAMRKKSE